MVSGGRGVAAHFPFISGEIMDIQATLMAAEALLRTAGDHVEAVDVLNGKLYITCAASATPSIAEAGGVWCAWYTRSTDGMEQRSMTWTVEGAEFCVFEVRAKGPRCEHCDNPATCNGRYEGQTFDTLGCDTCCGHGNEDGYCSPIGAVQS